MEDIKFVHTMKPSNLAYAVRQLRELEVKVRELKAQVSADNEQVELLNTLLLNLQQRHDKPSLCSDWSCGFFSIISIELVYMILSYLPPNKVNPLLFTCKRMAAIFSDGIQQERALKFQMKYDSILDANENFIRTRVLSRVTKIDFLKVYCNHNIESVSDKIIMTSMMDGRREMLFIMLRIARMGIRIYLLDNTNNPTTYLLKSKKRNLNKISWPRADQMSRIETQHDLLPMQPFKMEGGIISDGNVLVCRSGLAVALMTTVRKSSIIFIEGAVMYSSRFNIWIIEMPANRHYVRKFIKLIHKGKLKFSDMKFRISELLRITGTKTIKAAFKDIYITNWTKYDFARLL